VPIEVSVYAGISWLKSHISAINIKPADKKAAIVETPETINILLH
jgi:hypothetical protein